jgi:hypothetical protein
MVGHELGKPIAIPAYHPTPPARSAACRLALQGDEPKPGRVPWMTCRSHPLRENQFLAGRPYLHPGPLLITSRTPANFSAQTPFFSYLDSPVVSIL